ncbi:MAG: DNA translocase FtsK [bacterium]|nr:DNA translocase FtsK [bacterium]
MLRKKKNGNGNNSLAKKEKPLISRKPPIAVGNYLVGLVFFSLTLIIFLSFFGLAGGGGEKILDIFSLLVGRVIFLLPLFLILAGVMFFASSQPVRINLKNIGLATAFLIAGLSAVLSSFSAADFSLKSPGLGGVFGYILGWPLIKVFGFWVNMVFFGGVIALSFFIFWQLARKIEPKEVNDLLEKPAIIKRIFEPRLRMKEVPDKTPAFSQKQEKSGALPELKTKPIPHPSGQLLYKKPPLDLLEPDRGEPVTGDIRNNMAIIKRTLENFDIPVEMSEVNIGPTVTQYTLKPAEGIKLSKITTLGNDLSLALAAHPLRIEAPIPGKSLVGIEVPNKIRTQVRLKNILESPEFQSSSAPLLFSLGRDVAGNPCFADLGRMPHLLVAGSTGTGKTICLNSIITSLLYRNSPEIMRLILIDPKRVEFPVYRDLPHLLSEVIFDSQKTINALKWLVKEMERRFEVLAGARARDIWSYNRDINQKLAGKAQSENEDLELMPYIVVVIDELADLMAARGKEVEGGIVRLAQMARAVGIHLIVATQRPSVEVITGLIKANITSRITFQVASQVDSRTVIDMAGAEKLLGAGDLLFVSSETSRPKRLQGAYVSEKEVRRVTDFIKSQKQDFTVSKENFLSEELERELEIAGPGVGQYSGGDEDILYVQAKQLVIESKKASASLLQRRLRVGYARAARLLDILEERGVVGPADGAKPREVYIQGVDPLKDFPSTENLREGPEVEIEDNQGTVIKINQDAVTKINQDAVIKINKNNPQGGDDWEKV